MDHRIRIQGTADLSLALRSAREDAGLSQTEVARRLRTHQPSISALENEDQRLPLVVERILEHLSECGATMYIEWSDNAPRG